MILILLDGQFTMHRLNPTEEIPDAVHNGGYFWIGRTDEELSLVCDSEIELDVDRSEPGWSCLKVPGPIGFDESGVLAGLTIALAAAEISIVALSTFDTDYILVKTDRLYDAANALKAAGYTIDAPR